jgi:hypothetical protein
MTVKLVDRAGWTAPQIAQLYFDKIRAGDVCFCSSCSNSQGDHLLAWLYLQGFRVVPVEALH